MKDPCSLAPKPTLKPSRLRGDFCGSRKVGFCSLTRSFEPPAGAADQKRARTLRITVPPRSSPAPLPQVTRLLASCVAAVLPWAVAAAVLVAIPTTVVPVLGLFNNAELANREAEVAHKLRRPEDSRIP